MNRSHLFVLPACAAAAFAFSGPAQADVIIGSLVAQTDQAGSFAAGSSARLYGQTFTTPASTDNLVLTTFSVLRGGGAFGLVNNATASQDAIFLNLYTDGDGDIADNNAAGIDRVFVASSTNSVDHLNATIGDVLVWDFGGLLLEPDTKYFAQFSGTNADGDFVRVSFQEPVAAANAPVDQIPALENYYDGGAQLFVEGALNGPGLVIDEINDPDSGPRDILFEAVLGPVPEPSSLSLAAVGLALALRRGRASHRSV
ncbi:MAG: PEP-CTERM sorting domain-containing protein [Planctomycetota bacterium]